MFCTQCGKQYPEQANFCFNCGNSVALPVVEDGDRNTTATSALAANHTPASRATKTSEDSLVTSDVPETTTPGPGRRQATGDEIGHTSAAQVTPSKTNPLPLPNPLPFLHWCLLAAMVLFLAVGFGADSPDTRGTAFIGAFVMYYFLICYTLMSVAIRVGVPRLWRAWLPIFQLALLSDLALVSQAWVLALFVPLANFFVLWWLWARILPRISLSSGWASLMWVPYINAPVLAYVASKGNSRTSIPARDPEPVLSSASTALVLVYVAAIGIVAAIAVPGLLRTRNPDEAKPGPLGVATQAKDIYERTLPSVMTLTVHRRDGSIVVGTAFLAIKDGIAVTAAHVVAGATAVTARFSTGEELEAVGQIDADENTDVALLRLATGGRPLLALATQPLKVGSHIFTLGSPRGLDFSISDGIISQTRAADGLRVIQFTAPASPGDSGGPLLNDEGAVIGVISAQIDNGQNLNFAIAVTHIANLRATRVARRWTPAEDVVEKWRARLAASAETAAAEDTAPQPAPASKPALSDEFAALQQSAQAFQEAPKASAPQPQTAPSPRELAAEDTVVMERNSNVYHRDTCSLISGLAVTRFRRSQISNWATPCATCRPHTEGGSATSAGQPGQADGHGAGVSVSVEGLTSDQVIRLLGNPSSAQTIGEITTWYYDNTPTGTTTVYFLRGRATRTRPR